MYLEHKFMPKMSALIVDGSEVSGYASLFGSSDQGGDTVTPGAYKRSLQAMAERGGRVKMLWQHDPGFPIGVWDEVHEDGRGLWVKGRILKDVEKGREASALVAAGAIDGLSIGYRVLRAEKKRGGGRILHEIDLWEVSLVTFPMQPNARLSGKDDEVGDRIFDDLTAMVTRTRTALHALSGETASMKETS